MRIRAFTLIELLVVIAIIGILSAVVLASLNLARERGRLGAARQFAAQLDRAAGDQQGGAWEFDECSGTTVRDGSGNNNTGTLIGTFTWSTDTPSGTGCSLVLNGSGQYINIPDKDVLDIGLGSYTMSLWLKTTQAGATNPEWITKGPHYGMGIRMQPGITGRLLCYINDAPQISITATGTYNDGTWHHVACILDRPTNTFKLYVDGALKATGDASTFSGTDLNSTGNLYPSNSPSPAGLMDSIRIYTKALTAEAVRKEYAEGVGPRAVAVQ